MEFFPSAYPDVPFSAAVKVAEIVYLSGQIGLRADGTLAAGIEAQARQTMDNVVATLAAVGCTTNDVFKVTVMLEDMRLWSAFNAVYVEYFTPGRLPARSAFGTSGLALGALVEVECIARASDSAISS
jgi:reactive intermediate/imine deaminase